MSLRLVPSNRFRASLADVACPASHAGLCVIDTAGDFTATAAAATVIEPAAATEPAAAMTPAAVAVPAIETANSAVSPVTVANSLAGAAAALATVADASRFGC